MFRLRSRLPVRASLRPSGADAPARCRRRRGACAGRGCPGRGAWAGRLPRAPPPPPILTVLVEEVAEGGTSEDDGVQDDGKAEEDQHFGVGIPHEVLLPWPNEGCSATPNLLRC